MKHAQQIFIPQAQTLTLSLYSNYNVNVIALWDYLKIFEKYPKSLGLRNGLAVNFGFSCITSNTRGGGVRLQQLCFKSRVAAQLFSCRVPPKDLQGLWFRLLPLTIATGPSLTGFEQL